MSYIGRQPTVGNFQICDAISVVNNQAAYTMQVGSVNVSPESANHIIVSLNGVIQKPNSSFTVSGSTITFASNLVTNDVIDFIQILGDVLDLGVPSDDTVTSAKIADVNVTQGKIVDQAINEAKMQISNAPTNGYFLSAQSGNTGGLTWAEAGGGYTQSSVVTPSGASVEFTGIPSGTNSIVLKSYGLQWAGSPGNIFMQIGDSGGYETSGYQSVDFYRGVSAGDMGANSSTSSYLLAYGYSGSDYWNGNLFLNHVGGNRWVMGYWVNDVSEYVRIGSGQKILSGEITKLKIFNNGGTNADGGNVQIMYQ